MTTPARAKAKSEPPLESPAKVEAQRIIARVMDTTSAPPGVLPPPLAALQLLGIIVGQLEDLRVEIRALRDRA